MDDRSGYESASGQETHSPPMVAKNLRSAANTVTYLTTENDRLESENGMLRQRIDLMKKNSDLKTATVLSSIITWMDEKKGKGRDSSVSGHLGSPFRPASPMMTEPAYNFLQSTADSDVEGQEEMPSPRNNQPSVRFDTSRNTSRSPPEDVQPRSSAQYAPDRGNQRFNGSANTTPKSSFMSNSGMFENGNVPAQAPSQSMDRTSSSNGRCNCFNDKPLTENMLGPPIASSSIRGSSTSRLGSSQTGNRSSASQASYANDSMFKSEELLNGSNMYDFGEETRLGAKLARFSRPIDQVIGVRNEPTRYYQGIMELKPTRRLVGEISFQLDRRILDYVFSCEENTANAKLKKKRYYGYTVTHIFDKIRAESKDINGIPNSKKEIAMRYRLEYLMKRLAPIGYKLEFHAPFSQDMVNKYGLLSSPPERKTLDNFGLEDPRVLRMLVSKLMIFDDELKNTLILLDCLCLMAHEDGGPLFKW